jgi:hypothetical protein
MHNGSDDEDPIHRWVRDWQAALGLPAQAASPCWSYQAVAGRLACCVGGFWARVDEPWYDPHPDIAW